MVNKGKVKAERLLENEVLENILLKTYFSFDLILNDNIFND